MKIQKASIFNIDKICSFKASYFEQKSYFFHWRLARRTSLAAQSNMSSLYSVFVCCQNNAPKNDIDAKIDTLRKLSVYMHISNAQGRSGSIIESLTIGEILSRPLEMKPVEFVPCFRRREEDIINEPNHCHRQPMFCIGPNYSFTLACIKLIAGLSQ